MDKINVPETADAIDAVEALQIHNDDPVKVDQRGIRSALKKVQEVDIVNLAIDWETFDREKILATISRYDSIHKSGDEKLAVIYTMVVELENGETLRFQIAKNEFTEPYYDGSMDDLEFEIVRETPGQKDHSVAEFDFTRKVVDGGEHWNIKHRWVGHPYRGQKISSFIMDIMEDFLKRRSAERDLDQYIFASSGQPEIMQWLEKSGFKITEAHKEKWQDLKERLPSIKNGTDGNLVLYTGPDSDDEQTPTAYLFDIDEFKKNFPDLEGGPENPEVWRCPDIFKWAQNPAFYMGTSYRLKFEKKVA